MKELHLFSINNSLECLNTHYQGLTNDTNFVHFNPARRFFFKYTAAFFGKVLICALYDECYIFFGKVLFVSKGNKNRQQERNTLEKEISILVALQGIPAFFTVYIRRETLQRSEEQLQHFVFPFLQRRGEGGRGAIWQPGTHGESAD